MSEPPSAENADVLHRIADVRAEPPADLWTRIEAAHATRAMQRRLRRFAAGGVAGLVLIAASVLVGLHAPAGVSNRSVDVDWQARAQALELQLQTLRRSGGTTEAVAAVTSPDPAAIELEDIDHRLQAAYEHGAYMNELASLWKRRSELLDTLITARKEGLQLTRI